MNLKKVLLSAAVIGLFLFYSIHQQTEESDAQVVAPKIVQTTPTLNSPTPSVSSVPPPDRTQNNTMMNGGNGMMMGQYKDGAYTGTSEDVFYGDIQVRATIQGGRIADIEFLNYPADRATSVQINEAMMPILRQEAITAQSAAVDIVSGATNSSQGFRRSLADALAQAQ